MKDSRRRSFYLKIGPSAYFRLSPAQWRMAERLVKASERQPTGYRGAGRDAAAWYRTAGVLRALGLVTVEHEGDGYRATWIGPVLRRESGESGGD